MLVQCPHCGKQGNVRDDAPASAAVRCPGCGQKFAAKAVDTGIDLASMVDQDIATDDAPLNRSAATLDEIKGLLEAVVDALQTRASNPTSAPSPAATSPGPRQYKVLTQKDKWFSGKFDPDKLEQAINAYANQGWTVTGIATASFPGFGGTRDEMVVLMER